MGIHLLKSAACAAVAALALSACDDDKNVCTLPAFAGFRIEPVTGWNAGDSVTVTAVQSSLGDLLYKAEYKWSVACDDTTFTKNYDVVYDLDKSDPYIGIRLPEGFPPLRGVREAAVLAGLTIRCVWGHISLFVQKMTSPLTIGMKGLVCCK